MPNIENQQPVKSIYMKISVVIPLYNKERSIRRTIESVLSQSVQDFEILVVDDGSTDSGSSVVEGIGDSRVRLIKTTNNGVSSARNIGVKNAVGEYVFFLDADDVVLENCFQELLCLASEYNEASIFTANFIYEGFKSKRGGGFCKRRTKGLIDDSFKELFFRKIFLRTGNMLIRRDCFATVGFFNEALSKYEDLEFNFRLLAYFKVAYTPVVVFHYITANSELSTNRMDFSKEYASIVSLKQKKIYERLLLSEYLTVTLLRKIFFEKDYGSAILLTKRHVGSLHYIALSYIFMKLKGLVNKLI